MAVIAVENLTVRFGGVTALDNVSLEVGPNEILGVIGPNGAGRTTLFNVLCGFVSPDAGTIRRHDKVMRRIRPHHLAAHGVSRRLQGVGLFGTLTVIEKRRRWRAPLVGGCGLMLAWPTGIQGGLGAFARYISNKRRRG